MPRELAGLRVQGSDGRSYRVDAFLAAGGMGEVYRATELPSGAPCALKVLSESLARDPEQVARFGAELRAAGAVRSPHVVRVIDAGVDGTLGAPWVAMELLDGQPLSRRVASRPPTPDEALAWLRQIAMGLDAAHRAGVVHRDVKPENVFVCEGPTPLVKLLDFGIAKLAREGAMTTTGALGSPAWMAPEQLAPGRPTPAVDVWAYGLVAFFVLTGRPFWRSAHASEGSLQGLLLEISAAPIPLASERAAHFGLALPAALDGFFARCLARAPSERFPTTFAAFAALEAAWPRPAPAPATGRGLRAAAAAAALAAVVTTAGAIALGWRSRTTPLPEGAAASAGSLADPNPAAVAALRAAPSTSIPPTPAEFSRAVVAPCVDAHAGGRTPKMVVVLEVSREGIPGDVTVRPREGAIALNLVTCLHQRASKLRFGPSGAPASYSFVVPPPKL